jgi:hypothetical protein
VKNWLCKIGAIILLLTIFSQPAGVISVEAQSGARIKINGLDSSGFPTIRLEADVIQPDGSFVSNLQSSDFKVMENGILRPVDEIKETPNAVDFIVAINGGPIFANRLSTKTNLQLIKDALLDWVPQAQSIGKGDSVTLVTNGGVKGVHLDSPDKWTAAFNTISTELISATPSLTSLSKAIEQAISGPARPGMKQSILYVTPLMSTGQAKAIDSLAEQAAGAGIQINIWLAAPTSAKQPQAELSIQSLADRTGGQVYRVTGKEALPPIETYLQPLRRQYEILYRSRTNQSGIQVVALEVQSDKIQARSPEENFDISLKAPNVMYVNPVESVTLTWEQNEAGRSKLTPPEISLELNIEFPDKHPRNLVISRLLVDGQMVDERNSPSFTTLKWPISGLKTSGTYQLQVTIKDELGFTSNTVVLPLDVIVPTPPPANWLESISSERLALAVGAILLVVGGALLVQYRMKKAREVIRQKPASARVDSRPLDRPGVVRNISEGNTTPSLTATARDTTGWLIPISGGDTISTQPSIRLGEDVISLGSSPIRSLVVIPSPSVDGLHARIIRKPDGIYWLEDAGSVSGTWVNGTPVSNLGTSLAVGDVIRVGKVSFRFERRG